MSDAEAPRNWTQVELGSIVASAIDGPFGSNLKSEHYVDQPGVRVVRLQNIGISRFLDGNRAYISSAHAARLSRHQVEPGDLLVASLGDDAHPVARACQYPPGLDPAIVKADCFRVRLDERKAKHEFARWLLNSESVRSQLLQRAHGMTRDRVNLTSLKRLVITLPTLPEQRRIAQILEAADESIRSTERLVSKLELIYLGTLQKTFSGSEPNWAYEPVGELFDMQLGKMLSPHASRSTAQFPYLANRNVQWGRLNLDDLETMGFTPRERVKYSLQPGDILVCEGGEAGRTAIWQSQAENVYFQKAIHRLRSRGKVTSNYFYQFMRYGVPNGQLVNLVSQTSIAHLTAEQLAKVMIPVPSRPEQQDIVDRINVIHEKTAASSAELAKLRKIKQGLMEDLLTGRVRVRVKVV